MSLIKRVKIHLITLGILSLLSCSEEIPKPEPCLVIDIHSGQCKHAELIGDPKTLTFKQTDRMDDMIPGGYYIQPGGDNDFPHLLVFMRKEISACEQQVKDLQSQLGEYE